MTSRSPGSGRTVRSVIIAAAVLTGASCADEVGGGDVGLIGDTTPSNASGVSTPESEPEPLPEEGRRPEGFTTVQARITEPDGEVCEVCLWLADDADERSRGLMGVTDLGDPVGMAFRFDEPGLGSFYMRQTPTPLSIAWFAFDGFHVGAPTWNPCLDPLEVCPLYSPGVEYDLAIEVFQGGLEPSGLVPGRESS